MGRHYGERRPFCYAVFGSIQEPLPWLGKARHGGLASGRHDALRSNLSRPRTMLYGCIRAVYASPENVPA